jgi:hypothetical protein
MEVIFQRLNLHFETSSRSIRVTPKPVITWRFFCRRQKAERDASSPASLKRLARLAEATSSD